MVDIGAVYRQGTSGITIVSTVVLPLTILWIWMRYEGHRYEIS